MGNQGVFKDIDWEIKAFLRRSNGKAFLMILNGKSRRFCLEETMKRSH